MMHSSEKCGWPVHARGTCEALPLRSPERQCVPADVCVYVRVCARALLPQRGGEGRVCERACGVHKACVSIWWAPAVQAWLWGGPCTASMGAGASCGPWAMALCLRLRLRAPPSTSPLAPAPPNLPWTFCAINFPVIACVRLSPPSRRSAVSPPFALRR